jgi:hypothetical protein
MVAAMIPAISLTTLLILGRGRGSLLARNKSIFFPPQSLCLYPEESSTSGFQNQGHRSPPEGEAESRQ